MNKVLGYGIALIALAGLGYVIYSNASEDVSPGVTQENVPEIKAEREVVYGETSIYRIEMQYPSFGVPSVDAAIKAKVDAAVEAFKQYPANPVESSVPKNELTGSYDV